MSEQGPGTEITPTGPQYKKITKSQQTYLSEYRNNDFLEEALVQSRFRGIQSGVKYAEAFRCLRLAMRGRADRILP